MANILYIFVIIFIVMVIVKLPINLYKYFLCKQYLDKYNNWLTNTDWQLVQDKSQVIKLFKDANLQDSKFQFEALVGQSHIATGNAWVFDNFPSYREEVVGRTIGYFHQAIGVYRSKSVEVFNPFYWIELIIYLPKHVLNYLGVLPESVIVKIIQLLYWLVSILYLLYATEINVFIKEWISKLIS